tara:strand:- start:23830 stop:24210 length:381 start_codon:yes stop_codon:yes gene_type:complete
MDDIFYSSTGATLGTGSSTSGATATANVTFRPVETPRIADPDNIRKLKHQITKLENELTLERNENTSLLSKINDLEQKVTKQNQVGIDVFNDKELKIILSKIHPDKNQNKPSYNELTKKINLWRSK